jgi:uroporphyrinogen-III synthase
MPVRVLVVRSGAKSVLESVAPSDVVVVERVSHDIETVEPPTGALETPADFVIFTSRTAVVKSLSGPAGSLLRQRAETARVVAVGRATAAALRKEGISPAIVAGGSAKAVLSELPGRLEGVRVLLPCGDDAHATLFEGLRGRGASVSRIIVYRKVARPRDGALERDVLERPFTAFFATSPAAARWLWEGLGEPARERLRGTPAVALGPSTRATLSGLGVRRVEVSREALFPDAIRMLLTLAAGPGTK